MSSRNAFRKVAVLNGLKTTNLIASPSLTTSYNLTLPPATPTIAGQSLISDTAGNLSWGSSSGTLSSYTGTSNPLTTPTNVTGLSFTSSYSQINVYVSINATTNIYSLYNLKVYQKGSSSNWGLAYEVDCDTDDVDPYVLFTVTSTGQIQYTIAAVPGFTSVNMMWSLGTSVSNTLSSLVLTSSLSVGGVSTFTAGIQGTSLGLSSTFNVTGLATHAAMTGLSLVLGNAATSGTISSTVGTYLSLQNQTYTDTVTAASSTAAGTFSAAYLGIPTLSASNTAVTTTTASTLTIAGPPVAGTNETITNAYALSVLAGAVNFAGNLNVPSIGSRSTTPSTVLWVTVASVTLNNSIGGTSTYPSGTAFSLKSSKGTDAVALLQSNSTFVAQTKGLYLIQWTGLCNTTGTTFFVNPYITTYAITAAAASNVTYMPGTSTAASNGIFSTTLNLPMAVGDAFVLAGGNSVSNAAVFITCLPMGAF